MTDPATPSDTVLIAKFFEMKGAAAVQEIRQLTAEDKAQLGAGLRDGTLTYA